MVGKLSTFRVEKVGAIYANPRHILVCTGLLIDRAGSMALGPNALFLGDETLDDNESSKITTLTTLTRSAWSAPRSRTLFVYSSALPQLPVVQWIERVPPKRQIQVRFLSGGLAQVNAPADARSARGSASSRQSIHKYRPVPRACSFFQMSAPLPGASVWPAP